ncbi:putative trans-sialidase, Group V [Trypanosoma cruzi]|nr:putative trans-sialidase, Group V [Trypanosoma cruzi]
MHSRVAAVKAPRTHNRRCVTGSGGRRREGRESEQQRPNMSRRVFASAVLLLVVVIMCCCTGEATASEKPNSGKGSSRKTHFDWRDRNGGETVSSLRIPSLVELDGDVFAVAEAQCTKDENSFTGIASELLEWTDEKSKGELDTTKLKTQVLEECQFQQGNCASQAGDQETSQGRTKVRVSRPTTVVNGSRIYMFAGNYSFEVTEGADQTAAAAQWGLLVAVGNVSNDESSNKRIYWKDASVIPWTDFETQHESLTGLIGGGGSGVKMKDGTLVLPVEGTKKNGKAVSLIIRSSDAAGGNLSKGMSADGCSDPSVVEWKDKLMMMTACDDGRRRVYESADKGDSWTEALGTLSRVWSSKKGVRSGFITATIEDNRDVMLVTLPVYAKTESEEKENVEKGELHLWLTDNTHIADIGPVSVEDDDAAASSLLYKSGTSGKSETNGKEELIVLYEKKNGDAEKPSPGMVSMRLAEQLKRVKEVLATWKEVDERVSSLCPISSTAKDTSTGTACSAGKITDGLVGFLSGSFSDDTWKDEYLGVDATVKNGAAKATKTSDGVTFHGAWAEWPVGAQGENQLYHFANYNFTLVATVSIDKVPEGDTPIPLLGAKLNDGMAVLLGLSYDSGKKWHVLCGDRKTTTKLSSTWETGTPQHVAIVLQNGNQGFVYVDGRRVGNEECALENTESQEISQFYIGGDGRSAVSAGSREGVSVTVTNVLLYNRPLDDNEMTALNTIKLSIPQTAKEGETDEGTALDGGAHGDASNHCGSGLLPSLLLLLGLWWFAAL